MSWRELGGADLRWARAASRLPPSACIQLVRAWMDGERETANMPGSGPRGDQPHQRALLRPPRRRRPRLAWRVDGDDGPLRSRATPARRRPCSPGRVRALLTPDITALTHARRHASACGGRATPAAAVHHDGREDALWGQRAVLRTREHRTHGSAGAGRQWRSGRGG
jgi:hypothetical protein